MNATVQKHYQLLLWATCLIGAVSFFWGLGDIALLSYNEARRAIPTETMFATGDWLLPKLNGELYLAKPPLLYWLTTTASHLIGEVNEWSVRLPAALTASAIVIMAYRHALRRYGPWAALFTAQLLIANATFAMFARRAEIEMLLTALCFSALLAALHYIRENGGRRWIFLSYVLLGLAVLAKGPLALIFVTLPLLVYGTVQRDARTWQLLRDPIGWLIFLIVGGSWYLAVSLQMGFDIWHDTVQKDILNKVHGTTAEPVFNYVMWMLVDFLPASLLLLAAPIATWKRWKVDPTVIAVVIAIATPLLVFTTFSDKHAKYMLPVYPLVAILLGKRLGDIMGTAKLPIRRTLIAAGILLPLGFATYYAAAEARVFAYRYAALPQLSTWMNSVREMPVYGYLDLDERTVYYAGRTVPLLDQASLETKCMEGKSFLMLVENKRIDSKAAGADCLVREFKPYLKQRKALEVYGFGAACALRP